MQPSGIRYNKGAGHPGNSVRSNGAIVSPSASGCPIGAILLFFVAFLPFRVGAQTVPESGLIDITVPIFLDGAYYSETLVRVSVDDPEYLRIGASRFMGALHTMILPEIMSLFETRGASDGFLKLEDLADAGLAPEFRFDTLELHLSIPAELKQITTLYLNGRNAVPPPETVTPQAAVSGYFNLSPSVAFTESFSNISAGFDIDGAVNIRTWVAETVMRMSFSDTFRYSLESIGLKHDFFEQKMRLTLGDLTYKTQGLQRSSALKGISLASLSTNARNGITIPQGGDVLVIPVQSDIEIILNDMTVKTMILPPGRFRIEDLSLRNGTNSVTVRITDAFGERKEYSFLIPYSNTLLHSGESEFSYALGVPDWAPSFPTLSLYHLFGVSDMLNLGANFQTDWSDRNLGGTLVYTTTAGTFNLDAAISHNNDKGFDWSARGGHNFILKIGTLPFNTSTSVFWTGPTFHPSAPIFNIGLSTYIGMTLPFGLSAGLGFSIRSRYDFSGRDEEFTLSMRKKLTDSLSLSAGFLFRPERTGFDSFTGTITLSSFQPSDGQALFMTHHLEKQQSEISWSRQVRKAGENFSVHAGLQGLPLTSEVQKGVSLNAGYSGHQFTANLSTGVFSVPGTSGFLMRNNLRLSTAAVYADGIFSLSRPQSGSFVIASPPAGVTKARLGINPTSDGYSAAGPEWLPPVLALNSEYSYEDILLEMETDSNIMNRTGERFLAFPGYRSGTVLKISNTVGVSVRGTFRSSDGSPVSLTAGEFVPIAENGTVSDIFFTDEEGRFELYNLQPGDYSLYLSGFEKAVHSLYVPVTSEGFFDAGTVTLEKPEAFGEIR